jgi:hypothetical protein
VIKLQKRFLTGTTLPIKVQESRLTEEIHSMKRQILEQNWDDSKNSKKPCGMT